MYVGALIVKFKDYCAGKTHIKSSAKSEDICTGKMHIRRLEYQYHSINGHNRHLRTKTVTVTELGLRLKYQVVSKIFL